MKKQIVFATAFAILGAQTITQAQNMYVDVNLGWGLGMAGQTGLLSNSSSSSIDNYDDGTFNYMSTDEAINTSFGKGVNFGAAFGYMFNQHFGAELQVSYLVGGKTEGSSNYSSTTIMNGNSETYTSSSTTTFQANMLRVIPTFVFSSGLEKVNPYAKLGLAMGMAKVSLDDVGNYAGNKEITAFELNEGLALGLNTRLGVILNTNPNMSYFLEINMMTMSYAPKKGEMVEYSVNGVNMLGDLTTSEKEMEFVDSITYGEIPSGHEPTKVLKINFPFSSVGLNVGVRIAL